MISSASGMAALRHLLDRRATRAALLAAVVALGLAARLATWPWVFGGPEPRFLGDGDPLYQVLQAERFLDQGLSATWRDPGLNHPLGADVPWPPLFAVLLAGAGAAANGGWVPDRATLEVVALVVPALLGALMVLLVAFLGRALLGGRPWLDAALALALLPSHAMLSSLGRPDQHALEPVLFGLVVLGAARLAAGGGGRAGALLAGAVVLAFWNWNGSVLYLALLAGFAAAGHALGAPGDQAPGRTAARLAGALGAGAVLLAGSVALLAPTANLFTAGLSGLTGLQPTLVAGTALACAALAAARRLRPQAGWPERAATAAAALLLPAALLVLLPWTRDGIDRGLTMLAARGWYRTIMEFRPLFPSGLGAPADDLRAILANHGLTPLAVVAALPLAWRRWRRAAPEARGPILLFGVTALFTLVIGWARNRFAIYLSVAEALSAALVAREVAAALAARWPARQWPGWAAGVATAALLLGPALPSMLEASYAAHSPGRTTDLAPLSRLAGRTPSPAGREAVLAPWSYGHDVRYWSGRPVVSSPFGVEGGAGALEVDAAFHRATDGEQAEALLAARRVGFVVIHEPLDEVVSLLAFAPPDALPVVRTGPDQALINTARVLPAFRMLVATRLWLWDGMWGDGDGRLLADGPAALGGFRLLGDGPSLSFWQQVGVPMFKLFQVVPGLTVRVAGAAPGARVAASTRLRTGAGRLVAWSTHAFAAPDGTATLRLPYAAGLNGEVEASPWLVSDGRGSAGVVPTEREVVLGGVREVRL